MQASLPLLHLSTLFLCRVWARSLAPPSVLTPAPRGASHKGKGPGLFGGLHGGGPLLESGEKLGAGSDLNPRVPGEAKLPHPGAKGWTLAGAPAARPRNSRRAATGCGQRRVHASFLDSNHHAGTWVIALADPAPPPFALAQSSRLLRPRPCSRGLLCNPSRDVFHSFSSRLSERLGAPAPARTQLSNPGSAGLHSLTPHLHPQNFLLSISLPQGRKTEGEMKDTLLLLTPSNLRRVCTKLGAQGGLLGWNVQKSVVPAKN